MISLPEEAKVLIRNNKTSKNLRVHFPNGELEDITNKNITYDSLKFTESICSERNLKFGLLEGSSIQFEVFGVGNIKGYTIEVSLEFIKEGTSLALYSIPLGKFVVDSCRRQNDMSRRLVVAYSEVSNENSFISPLEKTKQRSGVSSKSDYKFDFFSFVASNTNNFYKNNNDLFSYEYVQLEDFSEIAFPLFKSEDVTIGSKPYLYLYGKKINIRKDDNNFNSLLTYLSVKNNNYVSQIREFKEEIESDYWLYCSPFANITTSYRATSGSTVTINVGTVFNVPIPEEYMIYPYITGLTGKENYLTLYFPTRVEYRTVDKTSNSYEILNSWTFFDNFVLISCVQNNSMFTSELSIKRTLTNNPNGNIMYKCPTIDSNKIVESYLELHGLFGKTSRNGGIKLISLKNDGLKPRDRLYPKDGLYPKGNSLSLQNRVKRNFWYEEYAVKEIHTVVVDYKNADGEDSTFVYEFKSPSKDKNVYYIKDNYFFKNGLYNQSEIKDLLDTYFIPNITEISYIPSNVYTVGIPYLEAGDRIFFNTDDGGIETIVLERTMSGIQTLVDKFDSSGDEVNEESRKIIEALEEEQ